MPTLLLALPADALTWALELGFAVYVAAMTIMVVLERRRPTTTLAILLGVIFVPILGLAIYLVFGRTAARREKLRRRRIVRPFEAMRGLATAAALPEDAPVIQRSLVRLAVRTAAAPVRRARTVELHSHPPAAYAAMHRAIETADRYLHLLFYIWQDDATGRDMVRRLAARARQGVRVRVLLDHLGSFDVAESHFAPLLDAGGELGWFGRLRVPWRPWKNRVNFRNHRKLLIADGEHGFIGGMNIGNEYSGGGSSGGEGEGSARGWRDMMVELHGDAVIGLDAVFLDDWLVATGQVVDVRGERTLALTHIDARRPAARRWSRPRARSRDRVLREHDPFSGEAPSTGHDRGPLLQVIPSGPDVRVADSIAAQVVAAIGCAIERVWIVTPYLVPDDPLLLALRTAALRGVDVRIVVPAPEHNDARLVALAAASYYDELLEAGARIFEYQAGMLHAKYAVFDDVTLVGSANMDVRSFHLNYEVVAMFYDASVTSAMVVRFSEDLAGALEITTELRAKIGRLRTVLEAAARVTSPLL